MAWELRSGRRYYYSARRVDGKVVKTYHGTGMHALMVELEVRDLARKRAVEVKERDDYVADLWQLESIGKLARTASRQAMYATYLLAGYERSDCYHWNRKEPKMELLTLAAFAELESEPPVEEGAAQELTAPSESKPQEPPKPNSFWPETVEKTIKLVMSGRRDLLEQLRAQLREVPDLWQQVSDLTRTAIQGWAKKISRGDVAFQESIVLASIEERKKLLDKAGTIMERAIVDRFIITKLQLGYFDLVASCADEATMYSKTGIAMEKRHASAQYQFREATRQLTKIRVIQEEIALDAPESASLKIYRPKRTLTRNVA